MSRRRPRSSCKACVRDIRSEFLKPWAVERAEGAGEPGEELQQVIAEDDGEAGGEAEHQEHANGRGDQRDAPRRSSGARDDLSALGRVRVQQTALGHDA